MQPARISSYGLFFIVLINWLNVNHAVASASYVNKKESRARESRETLQDPVNKQQKLKTLLPSESRNKRKSNSIFNSNVNVNEIYAIESEWKHPKSHQQESLINDIDNEPEIDSDEESNRSWTDSDVEFEAEKILENGKKKADKCAKERKNQRSDENLASKKSSVDFTNAFKVPIETEAKKTSSIHTGEDITLCWIETVTIKEDPDFDPPKRLVVREFTISFENSAAIPDNYLECTKMDGEIATSDEEAVCRSSLREVIVENTMRSRIENFKSVSHVGPIIVRQQKTVKCATGGIVSKDIYEWPDNSENPTKRVEIKVSPAVREVVPLNGENGKCATKTVPKGSEEDRSQSSECSGESCEKSCKDDETCNEANITSPCEDGLCVTDNSVTSSSPEDNESSERPERITTMKPTKSLPTKESLSTEDEHCQDCQTTEITNPESSTRKNCSGENCPEDSSDESATQFSSDESQEILESCSGIDCPVNQTSTRPDMFEGITLASGKSCQEDPEACACNGTSCSIENSGELNVLTTEEQLTDETTVNFERGTNETAFEDSDCDNESGNCSGSLETSPNEEEGTDVASTSESDAEVEISASDEEMTTGENIKGDRKLDDTEVTKAITTEVSGTEVTSVIETLLPCDSAESGGCSNVGTEDFSNDLTEITEESSTTEETRFSDPENDSEDVSMTTTPSTQIFNSKNMIFQTSEAPENITIPIENSVTWIDGIGSAENGSLSEEEPTTSKYPVTKCSSDSENGFGNCDEGEPSLTMIEPEGTTLKRESCESSGSCESSDEILNSTETNQTVNSTENVETSTQSSCNSESCENSSSGSSSEICDGDSSADCENKSSTTESCDSSSDSCTLEPIMPMGSINEIITVAPEPTMQKAEDSSTSIDDNPTTTLTPDSNESSSSMTFAPTEGRHKLALRIKVLLEHINENKEKERLVEVEKHLLLNEKPEEHGNHSLIWQIKSLNNSMNMETFRSIFNCTRLENFTEEFSNITDFRKKIEDRGSLRKKKGKSLRGIRKEAIEAETENDSQEISNESSSRKKREVPISEINEVSEKNLTDVKKEKAIEESLMGVNEDFQEGLKHVSNLIAQEFDTPTTSATTKIVESSTSKILEILADPSDRRVHSRRQKRENKARVGSIEEHQDTTNRDEIDHWSNERFVEAGDGGQVRSLIEFKISKDPVEESRTIPSGS